MPLPHKKESGSEGRKRRAENAKKEAAVITKISKFFTPVENTKTPSGRNLENIEPDAGSENESVSVNEKTENELLADSSSPVICESLTHHQKQDESHSEVSKSQSEKNRRDSPAWETESTVSMSANALSQDPFTWPYLLKPAQRDHLVKIGPEVVLDNTKFPSTGGRKFATSYMLKRMPNGETVRRSWLVYSKQNDSVYRFACKLFDSTSTSSAFKEDGYKDWKHLSEHLKKHEESIRHKQNQILWVEAKKRLNSAKAIDNQLQSQLQMEKVYWRNILHRILEVTRFLASHNLPFQGSTEKLFDDNNGNFLGLMELVSKFDAVLQQHLNQVAMGEKNQHYLYHGTQNEFISIISRRVKETILNTIRAAKYFSLILDCTPDVSHREQMSIVLRYVKMDDKNLTSEICESFLGFLEVNDKTGKGLTEKVTDFLLDCNLNISGLRGQSYDNGSNMKGKIQGVQKRILDINCRALFTSCFTHSLNLVICDAAKCSVQIVTFFGTVQKLYTFASGSTNRWDVFRQHLKTFTLKSHSTTRWESRIECIKPLRFQISEIRDALDEISDNNKFDRDTRFEASNLSSQVEKFEFLVMLSIWFDILQHLNIVSKTAQGTSFDVPLTINLLESTEQYFKNFEENGFEAALESAGKLADQLELEITERTFPAVRQRKKKLHFEERPSVSSTQTPAPDPQTAWKESCFEKLVKVIRESLEERFQLMKTNLSDFQILYDPKFRSTCSKEMLMKHCHDIHTVLTDNRLQNSDIDGAQLYEEFLLLNHSFAESQNATAIELLNFILKLNLTDTFPNVVIALRIVLTFPVTVASCERSFSKLKLIKTYLRSTMSQERLSGLGMLSIERDLAKSIDYGDIIDEFAMKKARRVPL